MPDLDGRRYDRVERLILDTWAGWSEPLTFEAFAAGPVGAVVDEQELSAAFATLVQEGSLVHVEGGYIVAAPTASHPE